MLRVLRWLLTFFRRGPWRRPPGSASDPYAWRPVPRKPPLKSRSGAVAVAEPDE
jgi:hypothetical protein